MNNESKIATALKLESQWVVQLKSPRGRVIVATEQEAKRLADRINSTWQTPASDEATP